VILRLQHCSTRGTMCGVERSRPYKRINAYGSEKCSMCFGSRDRDGQRTCKKCHAAYMRDNRPKYGQLTKEEKKKSNCRSYANTYQRRGHLKSFLPHVSE
jgi:hypothetical protein